MPFTWGLVGPRTQIFAFHEQRAGRDTQTQKQANKLRRAAPTCLESKLAEALRTGTGMSFTSGQMQLLSECCARLADSSCLP